MKLHQGSFALLAVSILACAPLACSRSEESPDGAAAAPAQDLPENVPAPAEAVAEQAPPPAEAGAEKAGPPAHTVVEKGGKVSLEYTLSIKGGQVIESNTGNAPVTYQHGAGQMLPAFEAQVSGLEPGATKEFDLTAEQAYGPVREELYQTVEAAQIPADARKVGTFLMAQAEGGEQHQVRVHEVKGDKIVLDFNHPLAGKPLHFAVKIVSIE